MRTTNIVVKPHAFVRALLEKKPNTKNILIFGTDRACKGLAVIIFPSSTVLELLVHDLKFS